MKYMIANWKMNGNTLFTRNYIKKLNILTSSNTIIICPPSALLNEFKDFKHNLGAQNCFHKNSGAFTGENSPELLRDLNCSYVLVGHSERRVLFNETDDDVKLKFDAIIENNMTPILCIGEKATERDNWQSVIQMQIKNFQNVSNIIIAYEPVWCIGTGLIPSINEINTALTYIRSIIPTAKTLYGGSVNTNNAKDVLSIQSVDGLLLGGASLKIDEFIAIAQ